MHGSEEDAAPRTAEDAAEAEDDNTAELSGDSDGAELPDDGEPEAEESQADEIPLEELCRRIEAVLFCNREPLTPREIGRATKTRSKEVRRGLAELKTLYLESGRAFELHEEAGGFVLLTRKEMAPYVLPADKSAGGRKLSPAAMEVLSVVAYDQPVSRMDVESVRGVASGPILRMLLEKGLVQVVGRGEGLGNPLLYGTTDRFLQVLGVSSLRELPDPDSIES
ncbi:MAG: SMC-Scp complex subunit ScpB [Planctomycetes bacterium]|nr:SMC-Scp complex subunit ScpB [Planctomycetota bacterium]